MEIISYSGGAIRTEPLSTIKGKKTIEKTISLELNGSIQRVRICADDRSAPPLIVVQAGPGFPLLHEVRKFQQKLGLERHLAVCYWDQRGCGTGSKKDAEIVSFEQQVNDLRALIRWAVEQSGQRVALLGVSLGATYSLIAAERETDKIKAVVAISPDIDVAESDASAARLLASKTASKPRSFATQLKKLGDPPYEDARRFQLRARLMMDAGVIENGKSFNAGAVEMVMGFLRTYGPIGAVKALRNMNIIQGRILKEIAELNVLTVLPQLGIPVHCILGGLDPLMPATARKRLAELDGYAVTDIPEAGHMAHYDRPDIVRSIVFKAASGI